jgi:hypothetical protein
MSTPHEPECECCAASNWLRVRTRAASGRANKRAVFTTALMLANLGRETHVPAMAAPCTSFTSEKHAIIVIIVISIPFDSVGGAMTQRRLVERRSGAREAMRVRTSALASHTSPILRICSAERLLWHADQQRLARMNGGWFEQKGDSGRGGQRKRSQL